MNVFTIITLHYEDSRPGAELTASIWIASGDRRDSIAEEEPTETTGWFKISEAINLDLAVKLSSSFASFLSNNGFIVYKEFIAD